MIAHRKKWTPLAVLIAMLVTLSGASSAQAGTPPVKEVLAGKFGQGKESSLPVGFAFPLGVAVAPNGNVYVADTANQRIQELTPTGEFVLMFGKDVNETTGGNICTQEEIKGKGVKCKTGIEGGRAGELSQPTSIAIDPRTHHVYVVDLGNWRVDEFTETGAFVLMFGKDVNETTGGNICTEEEVEVGAKCKTGVQRAPGSVEPGAFDFRGGQGDLLAVGGPADLLYVADDGGVQKFHADGTTAGELTVTAAAGETPVVGGSQVTAVAVDEGGDVYLVYRDGNAIRKFDSTGKEVAKFVLAPRQTAAETFRIEGLAVDSSGRLAVSEVESTERLPNPFFTPFGSLIDGGSGELITEFEVPVGNDGGMALGAKDALYIAGTQGHEVLVYAAVPAGELLTGVPVCTPGADKGTDATFDCALTGEVDAWGVKETRAWFEWGSTATLGERTTPPSLVANVKAEGEEESLVKVGATIAGLRPNAALYDRVAGDDHNVQAPERLTGKTRLSTTPLIAPRISDESSASFVKSSSAVLFGELNPENAPTKYFFQYGPCASPDPTETQEQACARSPYPNSLAAQQAATYAQIGTTAEVTGLQPATPYHYRLFAESENTSRTETRASQGAEATFTTGPTPVPRAQTGSASEVTATSAIVAGTVNPDGQAATYLFELGVYNGPSTQYGIVFSGPTVGGSLPVEESLALTGLQPGLTYAYRIVAASGYGTAVGVPATFTTAGLPSVLVLPSVLAQLPVPSVSFPKVIKPLTNAQKLATALKACKQKVKKQRASCERSARKKYPAKSKKK